MTLKPLTGPVPDGMSSNRRPTVWPLPEIRIQRLSTERILLELFVPLIENSHIYIRILRQLQYDASAAVWWWRGVPAPLPCDPSRAVLLVYWMHFTGAHIMLWMMKRAFTEIKTLDGVLFCCYYPPVHASCLYSPVALRLLMLLLFRWRSLWKNGKVPTWCCCCQCNTDIRGNYYSSCSSNLCHSVLSTARKLCILKRMVYSVLNFKR